MEDYVKVLPDGTWRKGGVRYADPTVSNALVSASGMMNMVFSAPYADSSSYVDPYDISDGEDDEE